MKIQNIFIGVLFLLLGYSGYQDIVFIDEQTKDSQNLSKRIIKAEANIANIIDHINNDAVDMLEIEKNLLLEIENLSEGLTEQRKTSSTFYEMYFNTQAQRVEKEKDPRWIEPVEPVEPVEPLERQYDEETGLHVPIFIAQEPEVKVSVASCPRPHNNLLPYIRKIELRRNYQFRVTYNVKDNNIVDIKYSKQLPTKLQSAIKNYLNSFKTDGDITECYVPIKLLRS